MYNNCQADKPAAPVEHFAWADVIGVGIGVTPSLFVYPKKKLLDPVTIQLINHHLMQRRLCVVNTNPTLAPNSMK